MLFMVSRIYIDSKKLTSFGTKNEMMQRLDPSTADLGHACMWLFVVFVDSWLESKSSPALPKKYSGYYELYIEKLTVMIALQYMIIFFFSQAW